MMNDERVFLLIFINIIFINSVINDDAYELL